MAEKKIVYYKDHIGRPPTVGFRAMVAGVTGHYRSELNGEDCITSVVIFVREPGRFETKNSIYQQLAPTKYEHEEEPDES